MHRWILRFGVGEGVFLLYFHCLNGIKIVFRGVTIYEEAAISKKALAP